MIDKYGKYLSPEDKEDTVFSSDKSQLHRDTVRDDLETSTQCDVILQPGYLDTPQQPYYSTGAPESSPDRGCSPKRPVYHQDTGSPEPQQSGGYTSYHRQEESRRHKETLDTVRFDGDIDLDKEKRRDQLGFRDYHYGTGEETAASSAPRASSAPMYSTAERFSHINDVEQPQKEARYGSVEKELGEARVFGGVAGAAAIAGSAGIFKTDDRGAFASSVSGSVADSIKSGLKASEAAAFADKTWGAPEPGEKKGILKTVAGIIGREVEAAVGRGGKDGDITDRAKGQATKYGYKAGKYAAKGGFAAGRGAIRFAKYGRKISNDVAAGVLTGSAAKKILTDRAKQSLTGSAGSIGNIIKTGAVKAVEDFHGSDDLGMQAITKPKDLIVGTKRTLKMAQATGRGLKRTVKTAKSTTEKIKAGGKAVVAAGKKVLANLVVLKAAGIAAAAAVVVAGIIAVVSSVVSVIPSLSLKSEDYEVSQTYLYITELDARMEDDIVNEDTRLHIPPIDEYRYYMNGVEVSKDSISVYTNADLILSYLDSRYEDYAFSGIIAGLFGTTVKGELETIHAQLHQVKKIRWTEEIEHESFYYTWTEYVYHMDIYLTTKTWEDYYETNKDTLLEPDQQQQYDALQEVGVYTFRQQLSSPFVGVDWSVGVSSRWGWRIHPISGELEKHLGLDIAMPGGTPINACNAGTIVTGSDTSGWGNYIKVVAADGSYTLYGHMSDFAVANGQMVNPGDVIGYVGTTGASTGNHLHLEYHDKDHRSLNPLIFTECEKTT